MLGKLVSTIQKWWALAFPDHFTGFPSILKLHLVDIGVESKFVVFSCLGSYGESGEADKWDS